MRLRLTPRRRPDPSDVADALDALVGLLRSGLTVPQALEEWCGELPDNSARLLHRTRRRARLGASVEEAVEAARPLLGDDLDVVVTALHLNEATGADPVPLLARAATQIRGRLHAQASGRAAAAGAKLSGWIVGGLPLVSLPLVPLAHAPLTDRAGLALLTLGLAATGLGAWWMSRLIPQLPTTDDPIALYADHVAAALAGGAPLEVALAEVAHCAPAPIRAPLAEAHRRTMLGLSWPDALETICDGRFRSLAACLRRADQLGVPPGEGAASFARSRREACAREFERELRRAPVLMVLPLVLCVLPAFVLLAIVPFLRGLAFA